MKMRWLNSTKLIKLMSSTKKSEKKKIWDLIFIKEFNQATSCMIKKEVSRQENSILKNREYKQKSIKEKC